MSNFSFVVFPMGILAFWCVYFFPDRACLYGVLAVNLLIRLWSASFSPRRPPHFFHMSLLIFAYSNYRFQNVLVAQGKLPNP